MDSEGERVEGERRSDSVVGVDILATNVHGIIHSTHSTLVPFDGVQNDRTRIH